MKEMKPHTFWFGLGAMLVVVTMLGASMPDCKVPPIVIPTAPPTAAPSPTPSPSVEPSPEPTATPTPVPTPHPTPTPNAACFAADTPDEANWSQDVNRPEDVDLFEALNLKMRELALGNLGLPGDSDRCWIRSDGRCPAPPNFVETLAAQMRAAGYCALARGDDTIGISRERCGSWHADVITGEGYVLWQRHRETWYWQIKQGCTEGPVVVPTPIPTSTPTPSPAPSPNDPIAAACGLPAPPPLNAINCAWHGADIIDCTPQVWGCDQEPNFCEVVGLGTLPDGVTIRCQCPPRAEPEEGQPNQRDACIRLITGGSIIEGDAHNWPDDGREPNPWMLRYVNGKVRICAAFHPDVCSPWFER
jgi:hypothetical protein